MKVKMNEEKGEQGKAKKVEAGNIREMDWW